MENDIEARRAAATEELRAAFAEIESGAGLTRLVALGDAQDAVSVIWP
jgi:hypothetical protein